MDRFCFTTIPALQIIPLLFLVPNWIMVKKKGKSKRTTLKDKYKMQRRVTETQRKRKKQGKKDKIDGVIRSSHISKKDPGIPNSWPFKKDLLKDIQKAKERQQQQQQEQKDRRKNDLRSLREHQEAGGSARTVQELVDQATADQASFQFKSVEKEMSDGAVAAGQQSRRAYLRELKKVIDNADVLLQVLDARDPIASRIHPSIEDAIMSRSDKRMVLVLNKIDLVPKEVVGSWLTALRRSHPTIAIKGNSLERRSDGAAIGMADDSASVVTASASSSVGADGLLQLLKNYARTGAGGGKNKTTIVVGVIGYPNVGYAFTMVVRNKRC
jgi:nuclear GTP-binding protein